NYTNHSNHLENHESDNLSKTGYSNSRLGVQSVHPQNPKLSFDAMTIVGNLSRDNAQKLSSFMSIEPQIRLWDILQTKLEVDHSSSSFGIVKGFEVQRQ